MAPEIPVQFQFKQLLSNTFPGFFFATTIFMLIDVWSPIDFLSWAMTDITGFVGFIGTIVLIGTIMGVIIDGIHHSIMEDNIFEKFIGVREMIEFFRALVPQTDISLRRPYFFKVDKAIEIDEYVLNLRYYYSEFYTNTFISLIPFSVISPFYLFYVLQIPWGYSLSLGLMSFFVACVCLNRGYTAYKVYYNFLISAICGYLDYGYYLHVKNTCGSSLETKIEATIIDKVSRSPHPKDGISVNFKTTLGKIAPEVAYTDKQGIAKITLTLDMNRVNNGIAIVTATSRKCYPGVTLVRFRDGKVCSNSCA